ncbi:MAG: pyruvate, phosphate dikinase [Bifidobacteriaceae bacterium]|nr:pyruvate, phosphate dikinase [Bifidobacteriaceae bacterium]
MPKYVYNFTEGNKDLKDLLGGKGANLGEMTSLGLPVPPGFTITTEACRYYMHHGYNPAELADQVSTAITQLEGQFNRQLGGDSEPLLVSVRSGAKFSMPGMMETVLNVGLNDKSVLGLAKFANDERFAWDSYRRLIQMFGKTVLGIEGDLFADALEAKKKAVGAASDVDLTAEDLKALVEDFKAIVLRETSAPFPQEPRAQVDAAIVAVFNSWNTERARIYRRRERISDELGTAVNVQSMVFGNLGPDSGTGVAFTRDPATGHPGAYGDYLPNAQGEDVVAGIRNTLSLDDMAKIDKVSYDELRRIMTTLENHYRDLCDIEFTVERGKLWMLQTRVGKRTAAAAFKIAIQLVDEGLINMDTALDRVTGAQLSNLMFPQFDAAAPKTLLTKAMAASPGAAVGQAVFDSPTAQAWAAQGHTVILVRRETNPDDLGGMIASAGILTARGGKTSHAAVVARGMGTTCVVGADALDVDPAARLFRVGDVTVVEGDLIAIDGTTGEVFLGNVPVVASPVFQYLDEGLDKALAAAGGGVREAVYQGEDRDPTLVISKGQGDGATAELIMAVHRILSHADAVRRLKVRANADNGEDAARARRLGAQGVGLCRTEHQFLGDRRKLIERLILAHNPAAREEALAALLPLQRQDFVELFTEMDGLHTTVRLIDPPLHEFLPDLTHLSVSIARREALGEDVTDAERELLAAVEKSHESNPMLGLRGVRLGLTVPGLFALQVRAIAEAAAQLIREGKDPKPEVMVPLIGSYVELDLVRDEAERIIREVSDREGVALDIPIGCMIELPRAAVTADEIARAAEFFSFGTNDLTQTTWGFSRDDVEGSFFSNYMELGVFQVSPFETIDTKGVGSLVAQAVKLGQSTRPEIGLGVCGEHGGDPESIHFFNAVGLQYVSCSPFRVPVARLEAGRAAVAVSEGASGTA